MTISVRSSPAHAAYLQAPTDMGHSPCNGFWGSVILLSSLPCLLWCNGGGAPLIFTLAFASFAGQITHPIAHELIHHPSRAARRLGHGLYASLGMGHHASAHLLIHHPYVATARDPNSPVLGVGFWAYLPRAWWGSFHGALARETVRRGGVTWAHICGWPPSSISK